MTIEELRIPHWRAVLDCLAVQSNPNKPKCSGCRDSRLCDAIREALRQDLETSKKLAKPYHL